MENDEKAIVITHFINPYQFWYSLTDDQSYESVRDLEDELTDYFKCNYGPMMRDSEIVRGSEIAVRYLPRSRFIRVRVEEIIQSQQNAHNYIVWAIDHGFPFKTKAEYCRRMPDKKFNQKIDRIRCGGIEKIVPACLEYNFLEQKQATVLKDKWCSRACESLNKIISDAASIEFVEHFNRNGQYWGDLIVRSHQGNVQHASDYLTNQNVAVRSVDKFKKVFLIPKRYLQPTWQTNDGNNNYKENSVNRTPFLDYVTDERSCNLNESDLKYAKIKVAAWEDFNKKAAETSTSKRSVVENIDNASMLYEDVDDSASKVALTLRSNRNRMISIKKAEPVPTLDDFGVTENNKGEPSSKAATAYKDDTSSNVTVQSKAQSRSEHLRVLRLKHLLDKKKSTSDNYEVANMSCSKTGDFIENSRAPAEENSGQENLKQLGKDTDALSEADSFNTAQAEQQSVNAFAANLNGEQKIETNLTPIEKYLLSRRSATYQKRRFDTPTNCSQNEIHSVPKSLLENQYKSNDNQNNRNSENMNTFDVASDISNSTIGQSRAHLLSQLRIKSPKTSTKSSGRLHTEGGSEASINTLNSNAANRNSILLPAGFDLANLNKYNKKDHWHCKETTRDEYYPHQDQDFRFTRASNVKKKTFADKVDEGSELIAATNYLANQRPENTLQDKMDIDENDGLKSFHSNTDANFVENDDSYNDSDSEDADNSNASSRISMYSAKSYLDDDEYDTEHAISKIVKAANTQTPLTTKRPDDSEKTTLKLKDFIKTPTKVDDEQIPNFTKLQPVPKAILKQQESNEVTRSLPGLIGDKGIRQNYSQHKVLAHAKSEVKPIESFNKISLAPDVRVAMTNRGFNTISRTQSYAWPHLLQGKSAFIINPPDSCKTWCYIPTLCTAIIDCLDKQLAPSTNGPLAIVLAASSDRALTVSNYCSYFLRKLNPSEARTLCSFGVRDLMRTKILLMEGCAILVATPPNFRRLLEDNVKKDLLFNSQRLRHIIVDDIDVMLSRCRDDVTTVLKALFALAPRIESGKKLLPQLVVTSRSYSPILEKLITIANEPLLIIGDFLEAGVYGKIKICFEICAKSQKVQRIIDFIKEHPLKNESLMILCNRDEDVFTICEQLQLSGIDCLGCHSEATTLVRQEVNKWKLPVNIHSRVLVCTDSVLYEYEIRNVQNVIHYSLAWKWAMMKFRFSVHKEMYENRVKNDFSAKCTNRAPITSLILLDEENNEELPTIIEFLNSHNQLKNIGPDVIKLSKRISIQREKERCKSDNQFCDLFFEYGKCDKILCQRRHMLTEDDIRFGENHEGLVQSGDIRMLVLNVYSPTHYAVRLLEHRQSSTGVWRCIRQSDKAASFLMKFHFFYTNSDNLSAHWPIRVNDICVLERNGSFHRVRVLEVPSLKTENIIKTIDIKLKLIDDGDILTEKSDYLYSCHEQFKDFPAQASIVRLIGLRPLDNETSWDADTTFYVKGILMNKLHKDESICASVSFSLVDTIIVRNILVLKKLPTLGNYIVSTNLKRDLAEKEYAVLDENAEQRIRNTIKDQGLDKFFSNESEYIDDNDDDGHNVSITNKDVKVEQTEPEEMKNVSPQCKTEIESKQENNVNDVVTSTNSKLIKSRDEKIRHLLSVQAAEEQALVRSSIIDSKMQETPLPKLCTFLDFLQALQRSNELDAEDYDLEADGMEEMREYINQTDKLCKLEIIREMERQNNKAIMPATTPNDDDTHLKSTSKRRKLRLYSGLPLDISSSSDESDFDQMDYDMNMPPTLQNVHKRPQTSWYETNHMIILSITAPDIDDYHLEVEKTYLYFMTTVNGVDHILILNFLGTVEPQYTSHEIRGLSVLVRLVKTLFVPWPRLTKQEEKMPWLNYDLNMLNVGKIEKILPQQFFERVLHNNQSNKPYEIDETDDSDDDLETYTRIMNPDDVHDPINAERF